jgi:hypothetical protein
MPVDTSLVPAARARKSRGKGWLVIALSALAVAGLGYLVASPYLTLLAMRSAVRAGDPVALAEHVDFPALRHNMKARLVEVVARGVGSQDNSLLSGLALGVATNLADRMVDSLVTPAGLEKLMAGETPPELQELTPLLPPPQQLLDNARYAYEAFDRFVVSVPVYGQNDVRFVLTRSGIGWKLSDIEIPTP